MFSDVSVFLFTGEEEGIVQNMSHLKSPSSTDQVDYGLGKDYQWKDQRGKEERGPEREKGKVTQLPQTWSGLARLASLE